MSTKNPSVLPEFSRLVAVDELETPLTLTVEADAAERARLARRFELLALDRLSAEVTLSPLGAGGVRLDARLAVHLSQRCSVTLEAIDDTLAAEFSRIYATGASAAGAADDDDSASAELEIEGPNAPEPPEPLVDGIVDVGEVVAEQLGLEINPFPRKKGVEFQDIIEDSEQSAQSRSPFQALAALKAPPPPDD